jgi:hypothetical protein
MMIDVGKAWNTIHLSSDNQLEDKCIVFQALPTSIIGFTVANLIYLVMPRYYYLTLQH